MSKGKDNEMWRRIEDAFTPNREELHRAARELARIRIEQGTESTPDRSAPDRANRTADATDHRHPRPRPSRRVAAVIVGLALLAPSVAWVGTKYVWPAPLQLHNLEFLEAEQSATTSSSAESDWELGLAYMAGRHQSVTEILMALARRTDPVGRAAEGALKRFGNRAIRARMSDERQIRDIAREALDEDDVAVRVQAVQQLEAFLYAAEEVLTRADASTPKREQAKAVYLKGIEKRRRQVVDGTHSDQIAPRDPAQATSDAPTVIPDRRDPRDPRRRP